MDHSQGSRVEWIVAIIIASVKTVVDDDSRVTVITQWTPADIITTPIPMNPGRPPMAGGDPVPSQPETPMPTTVMVDTPAPGFIRDPIPADDGIPDPAAVVVRAPIMIMIHGRNPDIPVGPFIHPSTMIGKLFFVFIHLFREVFPGTGLSVTGIPRPIPICKTVFKGTV